MAAPESITLVLRIPISALQAVLENGKADADAMVSFSLNTTTADVVLLDKKRHEKIVEEVETMRKRKKASIAKRKATWAKRAEPPPTDVMRICAFWNAQPAVTRHTNTSRNRPLTRRLRPSEVKLFVEVLTQYGPDKIEAAISRYLLACEAGQHVMDNGATRAYADVVGLIKKLHTATRMNEFVWWMDDGHLAFEDPNPAVTKRVANSFASTFLGTKIFPLDSDPRARVSFSRAGRCINEFVERYHAKLDEDGVGTAIRCALRYLVDLRDKQQREPRPEHLADNRLWTVTLPGLMKAAGII